MTRKIPDHHVYHNELRRRIKKVNYDTKIVGSIKEVSLLDNLMACKSCGRYLFRRKDSLDIFRDKDQWQV